MKAFSLSLQLRCAINVKEFASAEQILNPGNKFFLFRDVPIFEEAWYTGNQTGSHKFCLPLKEMV